MERKSWRICLLRKTRLLSPCGFSVTASAFPDGSQGNTGKRGRSSQLALLVLREDRLQDFYRDDVGLVKPGEEEFRPLFF